MQLKEIIQASKTITDFGSWKSGQLMPKSAFPLLGKTKLVRQVHTWKIIKFNCLGKYFRLLVFFRADIELFYCWLGLDTNPVTLIAKYEYHATHPGWHIHACPEVADAVPGRSKGHFTRIPGPSSYHRNIDFGISTETEADNKVIKKFRLDSVPLIDDLFSNS